MYQKGPQNTKKDILKGKQDNSGATEHKSTRQRQFNWIQPKTIARENDCRERKIREAQQKGKGSKQGWRQPS